ncbi:MAG: enoyl-CoA hydratase [Chloroflexi bacterium]|nr:enoyl-CoA hydratase [Chloroflexota bacterium]MYB21602.1 enoyl-CoA hydratase [Chloroflexota bacterium]MYD16116.1 enoyl-CoA hydratase [Chloroflexota bacterium]MYF82046.1 enoyl-CoA hydratase [Chloroflexota bacterium]MYI03643.1 enoyl-CoA hydratase [Chloroflexota bacterium]
MTYEQILTETIGRVGVIRLNRPEKLNAWTDQMASEMATQIEAWNADDGVGAIVIAGEGRAFCAGADLQGFNQRLADDPEAQNRDRGMRVGTNWTRLIRESKPVIAAIHGYAVGVGLTMALPCDVRYAAEDTRLSIRFVRVGLVPELGSTRLLAQLVGLGHATDICLSGRMVPADEAYRIGLVSAVVPKEDLFATALAKAEEYANNPTAVVRKIKTLLNDNVTEPNLDRVMEREGARDRESRRLPSHEEAVTAFLEKRDPVFNQ